MGGLETPEWRRQRERRNGAVALWLKKKPESMLLVENSLPKRVSAAFSKRTRTINVGTEKCVDLQRERGEETPLP